MELFRFIGASEASPLPVCNVEILSVCVSVMDRTARYSFFVLVTLYQILRDSRHHELHAVRT